MSLIILTQCCMIHHEILYACAMVKCGYTCTLYCFSLSLTLFNQGFPKMELSVSSKGMFQNFKSSLIEEVLLKDHIRVLLALEENYNLCFTINYIINSWNCVRIYFHYYLIVEVDTVTSWSQGNMASACSSVKQIWHWKMKMWKFLSPTPQIFSLLP